MRPTNDKKSYDKILQAVLSLAQPKNYIVGRSGINKVLYFGVNNIPTHAVMESFGICEGSVHIIQIPLGLISSSGQSMQLFLSALGSFPEGHSSHLPLLLTFSLSWQGLHIPCWSTSPAMHKQFPWSRSNPVLHLHSLVTVLHVFLWRSVQWLCSVHSNK